MIDIRKFRKERKLTQVVFGEMLGYSHAYISNIENGKEKITDNFLDQLHRAFGIEVEEYKSYNRENASSTVNEDLRAHYSSLKKEYEELQKKYTRVLEEKTALQDELLALRQRSQARPKDKK